MPDYRLKKEGKIIKGRKNATGYKILKETCARHIVILFHSFKNIFSSIELQGQLELNNIKLKEKIIKSFLAKVLEKQGWKTYKLLNRGGSKKTLKEEDLFLGVKQYLSKDYLKFKLALGEVNEKKNRKYNIFLQ